MRRRALNNVWTFVALLGAAACSDGGRTEPPDQPGGFPKIERFAANATQVAPGGKVILSYKVANADSVEITPDVLTPPKPVLEGMVETPPILETTTFTLKATSENGETQRPLTITVESSSTSVRIASFTATPEMIAPGAQSELRWSVVNATAIRLEAEGAGVLVPNADPDGTFNVNPADTTTYILTAEGEDGPVSERRTVVVGKLPEIVSLTATPDEIAPGAMSSIAWEVTAATGVRLLDEAGGVINMSSDLTGTFMVSPAATTAYVFEAINEVGPTTARITVRVIGGDRPVIDRFVANPTTLPGPGMVTVEWTTMNATSVSLTADGVAVPGFPGGASGNFMVNVAATTIFELTATNNAGPTTQQTTVTVTPPQDSTPPTIDHTPVLTMQVAGNAVAVAATITDADSGVAGATLFYRAMGAANFQSVAMSAAGDTYSAMIPAAAIVPPGADYYIEARDAAAPANVVAHPANAPATVHSFQVAVQDMTPPVITHAPIGNGQLAGAPINVQATITDAGSGVGMATLFYRRTGGGAFTNVALSPQAADQFTATIPGAAVQAPSMEYYIEARDGATAPNTASSPAAAPGTLHTFTVTPVDMTPPIITHTPIADGQTANGAVTVRADVSDASGVAAVRLFYRRQGQPTFTSAAMSGAGGSYSGVIPAATVQPAAVEYYIEATDAAAAANVGRAPATAPGTPLSFTVTMVDTTAPAITHSPMASPQAPGQAVTISAQITDTTGVASATLFYRARGTVMFTSVAMTGGPTYSAMIPAAAAEPPGLEYYIRAQDSAPAPNSSTSPNGAPTTVNTFSIGISETEPNNTPGTATVLITGTRRTNAGHASIAPTADDDWFAIDVPAGGQRWNIRAEVTAGGPGLCPSPISTFMSLFGSDGSTLLVSDSFDGVNSCSLIDPVADSAARALAPGRYYIRVDENGDNATIGAYELTVSLTQTRCGNNILEVPANEQCDDGNTSSGDGCSATCAIEPEGVVTPPQTTFTGDISPAGDTDLFAVDVTQGQFIRAEITDGGTACPGDLIIDLFGSDGTTLLGSDDDDGIGLCPWINPLNDSFARNMNAGRYFLRVRAAVPTDVVNGYRLRVEVLNGICGNGTLESGEQCDDNNSTSFDGCDASCQWETAGTANGMGASFMGSISPVGNRDFYAVVVQQGDSIRAETFAPNADECLSGNDTVITLYATNRSTVITSDDEDGLGSCSRLDPANDTIMRNLNAGTYYLAVQDYQNNGTIASYVLDVEIRRPGCGNGWLDGADVCDDGNTMNGDGCSATCTFEGPAETEPNETSGAATPLITGGGPAQATLLGSISNNTDTDVFSIVVPAGNSVWAEVSDGAGGCPNAASLRLLGTNGTTSLVFDTTDGPGSCGQISPARDTGARALTAGTYFLEVEGTAGSAAYRLTARVLAPGCGDFQIGGSESCDDGNTNAGDGCSATCQIEGNGELEPNGTSATATPLITGTATLSASIRGTISSATDLDRFRVEVPNGYHLFAEVSDGAGGCGNSEILRLFSSSATALVSDTSDGPATCGRISAGLDTVARGIAGGTYYLEVDAAAGSSAIYTLDVRLTPPNVCGNIFLDAGETCDDGNTTAGDGCSATCALETNETEPNGTSATATQMSGTIRFAGGAITSGDVDYYRITVPANGSISAWTSDGARDQCVAGLDSLLEIRGPDGSTIVADDDDDGAGLCSHIDASEASNLAAGTYFVRVAPYQTATFSYVLTVEIR